MNIYNIYIELTLFDELLFSQRIKLRNASKNEYWEKSNSPDNVRQLI